MIIASGAESCPDGACGRIATVTAHTATPPVPADLLQLAVGVAREAAELVARGRATAGEQVDVKSSPVDVVTAVDTASERLIVGRLTAARPEDGVLGEEGASRKGTSGVRWVVDPIDGTVNFLYGVPAYAVSIAAEVDGVVCAGAVLNAARALRVGGATVETVLCAIDRSEPGENLLSEEMVEVRYLMTKSHLDALRAGW